MALSSSHWKFLKVRLGFLTPFLFLGVCASLVLGLISATILNLIGPAFQLLLTMGGEPRVLWFHELFGQNLGGFISSAVGSSQIHSAKLLKIFPLLLIVLTILKALIFFSYTYIWEFVAEKIAKNLRVEIITQFLGVSPSARLWESFLTYEHNLASIITVDTKLLKEYIVHFFGGIPRELFQLFFLCGSLYFLSAKLCLLFLLGLIPAIFIIKKLGKKVRKKSRSALSDSSELSEWLQQRLLGIETIKQLHTEDQESQRLQKFSEDLSSAFFRAAKSKAKTGPTLEFISVTCIALVLALAIRDIRLGALTGATALSFFSSLIMVGQSASILGRYFNQNREGSAAIDRILELLQGLASSKQSALTLRPGPQGQTALIHCKNISVFYGQGVQARVRGFSYDFEPGKFYCIAGPSGAGKSTLLKALLGILTPTEGDILFHPGLASHKIGYMPQKPELFSGTLAENVVYPLQSYDRQRLIQALESVKLWGIIEPLLFQERTEIASQGLNFSGGEEQRIFLARLYYHAFPLILCDEGTSALDSVNEILVYESLKKLVKDQNATVIMVSHRKKTLEFADKVLLLENGRLIPELHS